MPGTIYGQHFSVRVPDVDATRFDALATAAGLRRSELLRLVILRTLDQPDMTLTGDDLRRARTIGGMP